MNCRICESEKIKLIKKSNIPSKLSSKAFAITDSNYGVTGDIFKCGTCGFLQCLNMEDVLPFYEELEDQGYEATRKERALQEKKILEIIKKTKAQGRLLDIGAGSGILVEEALNLGFEAVGLEPSKWLYNKSKERNLPVFLGTFPDERIKGLFDIITIIDVIEHVPDPVGLLKEASKALSKDGVIVITTPDVNSFFARILGFRWWHFRIAHIGYFNKKTLSFAGKQAGLKVKKLHRPSWYFQGDYLFSRIMQYLPKFLQMKIPNFLKNITIPVNLRDSMLVICKK